MIDGLERAKQAIARARELQISFADAERYRRLVAENEDRVKTALAAANPEATRQMQRLEAQRREYDDRLLQLAADRAALRQQLGTTGDGTTQESLSLQLRQASEQFGVPEPDLDRASAEAEVAAQRAQLSLIQAEHRTAEIRRQLTRAVSEHVVLVCPCGQSAARVASYGRSASRAARRGRHRAATRSY